MNLGLNKLKEIFSVPDDERDDDVELGEETSQNQVKPSRNMTPATISEAVQMMVVEPKVFEDSETIAKHLRDMRPVVINFEETDAHEAARIVDFISGSTFALDGKIEKIGKDIFICAPKNISVERNSKAYPELPADGLGWKAPEL